MTPGKIAPPGETDAILSRLMALHPKAIDLSLGRMTRLLDRLGNPERTTPPVFHVAGTNGKGSVVAYLEAILRAAGYRVNSYISPHLVRFNERIRLDGAPIDEDGLAESLAHCEDVNDGAPITFFEITTAAAFHAFAQNPADALVLEVGLGGRLDATNVIAQPALTAITPVSIDHTSYLGDSLALIAAEKAGILKPDVPAVIGKQEPEASEVITASGREVGAQLVRHGREWSSNTTGACIAINDRDGSETYPLPGLAGGHQRENAALAVECARRQTAFTLGREAITTGLTGARWPGRLQRVPWPGLADDWELWLDGGHNAAAGAVLGRATESWSDRPLVLVVGMLNTRPPADFLRPLACSATRLIAVPVLGEPASAAPEEIRDAGRSLDIESETAESLERAITQVSAQTQQGGRILVCGSLYLVGHALAAAGVPAA
jgi:dihydrofolate synthase/folylpolyglutamate synthase